MPAPLLINDISTAIAGSKTPILFIDVENTAIIKSNTAFVDHYGDFSQRSLYDLFDPFYADQLRWLLHSGDLESDKVIFGLSVAAKIAGEVMVQYWPINRRLALLSVLSDYGTDRLADLDALTGLPNRRKSEILLEIEVSRLNRSNGFCLALADIDFFKTINDRHGHEIGDEVLRYIAEAISSQLRGGDWVARWGGEEFLIFIHNNDLVTGMQPIERIRRHLSETPPPGLPQQKVTMSFGLVSSAAGDISTLINKADILLYEAKNNGRNCIAWEESGEITWVLDKIQNVIDERRLRPAYSALRRWDGGIDAAFVKHKLDGLPATQIRKLLSAADRLLIRAELDKLLIEKAQEEISAAEKVPILLPISNDTLIRDFAAVEKMFKDNPRLVAAILSNAVTLNDSWEKFFAADIPFALFNFDSHRTPVYLLARRNLRFVIYPHPHPPERSVVGMATRAKFYGVAAAGQQPTAKDLSDWQENGFTGYLQAEENDSLADLLSSQSPVEVTSQKRGHEA